MSRNGHWTPTQQAIMNVLSDGNFHPMEELIACLPDRELGSAKNVRDHLSDLRKRLIGHDIYARTREGKTHYQLVRLIGSANE